VAVAATNQEAHASAAAATGYAGGSVSVAKNALGALNINPRSTIEETAMPENMVQCIDHRPVPVTSPSATPVSAPSLTPLRLDKIRCFQVSQTPTPFSRCNSFVDLNPSPLPQPDCLVDSLLNMVASPSSKVHTHARTHTHTGPFSGTTRVSRYQKSKTYLDFTEARDSEWQWPQLGHMQLCTSFQTDNHASTPPLSFYRPAALPAAQPTASKH